MPGKPRFVLPGVPQHVMQRGHNREPCFYSENDYVRYLDTIHAFVLMTNHVHLLVTPAQTHISTLEYIEHSVYYY